MTVSAEIWFWALTVIVPTVLLLIVLLFILWKVWRLR